MTVTFSKQNFWVAGGTKSPLCRARWHGTDGCNSDRTRFAPPPRCVRGLDSIVVLQVGVSSGIFRHEEYFVTRLVLESRWLGVEGAP